MNESLKPRWAGISAERSSHSTIIDGPYREQSPSALQYLLYKELVSNERPNNIITMLQLNSAREINGSLPAKFLIFSVTSTLELQRPSETVEVIIDQVNSEELCVQRWTYGEDGTRTMKEKYSIDADTKTKMIERGHYQLEELPQVINFEATVASFIEQVNNPNPDVMFSKPTLIAA